MTTPLRRVDAAITALNTKTAGYVGTALALAVAIAISFAPPAWIAHLMSAAGTVGTLLALVGRWKTFLVPHSCAQPDVAAPSLVATSLTPPAMKEASMPTNVQADVSVALGILNMFAGSNPTVQAAETVLPQIMNAIAAEKAGQSFSLSVPLALGGVKGNASFSWSPAAPAAAA